jgi:hypothetical protein
MPNISSMSARYRTSQRLLRAQLEGEVPCGRERVFRADRPSKQKCSTLGTLISGCKLLPLAIQVSSIRLSA